MIKNKFLWLFLTGFMAFFFSGCGSNSQNGDVNNAISKENVVSEELHQAQCDLLAKANEEFAKVNQQVRNLNDKIREKGSKLTDAQNAALDDFEAKQISLNNRMHQIKNVKQADWENFKTTFEKDLEELQTKIDGILNDF